MWRHRRTRIVLTTAIISAAAAGAWFSRDGDADPPPLVSTVEAAATKGAAKEKRKVSLEARAELLARARVWREPDVPPARASFRGLNLDEETCRFKVSDLGGTTPKFDCFLESGEEVRIKYGNGPEVPAEAAASRLLRTLGFGADHITLVRRLRCYGCPEEPFSTMRTVEVTRSEPLFKKVVDYSQHEDFEWVALERKFDAQPIESNRLEGWSFFELDTVDEGRGGAPRAHIDGLRLMAVLLAHWDNKSENQRLVCLDAQRREDEDCAAPFLLMQDVGATFGPVKMDFAAWRQMPVWENRQSCTVSMRQLPFQGATFGQAQITEAGRQFMARLLSSLRDDQLTQLFDSARFGLKRGLFAPTDTVADWVRVFREKARSISDGPPCPLP